MTMTASLQVLPYSIADGHWNMAFDQAMLEHAGKKGRNLLRFYAWSEPTLSLGYFQSVGDRAQHAESLPCTATRRLSGGGAILHDHDLTYCLAISTRHDAAKNSHELYAAFHDALVKALSEWSVPSAVLGDAAQGDSRVKKTEPERFLCFQRRSPGDVVSGEEKIAGSAQRRRQGAILQHGSVLLARSAFAPQLPGIREITGREIDSAALMKSWLRLIVAGLRLATTSSDMPPEVHSSARVLVEQRYGTEQWVANR